jgi:hypothetical protein
VPATIYVEQSWLHLFTEPRRDLRALSSASLTAQSSRSMGSKLSFGVWVLSQVLAPCAQPNVMVPRHGLLTWIPVRPKDLYSMGSVYLVWLCQSLQNIRLDQKGPTIKTFSSLLRIIYHGSMRLGFPKLNKKTNRIKFIFLTELFA